MKKPVLATMGVIGACAACCTIPLALPLLSGLSVAGLASIDWECLNIAGEAAAVGAGMLAAGLVGGGIWWQRNRKARAACAAAAVTPKALAAPGETGCGCAATSTAKEVS